MNKNTIIYALLIALMVSIILMGVLKSENETLKKKLSEAEESKIILLKKYIETCKDVPTEIAKQLADLKSALQISHPDIAKELGVIEELLERKHNEIAIEKLTKCLENILKDKIISEGLASNKRSCPRLYKILEIAKNKNWLSLHHYNFFLFLKEKRNEEAHEVGYKIGQNEIYIAIFSGIEIMSTLTLSQASN